MGVYYETIPDSLRPWILAQKMLWVGTAPLSPNGHINISPKGGQTFGIPNASTFWFMDLTGSGVETTAHLHEPGNGRICIMFMAFEGPPRILRLWGQGKALEFGTAEFDSFVEKEGVKLKPGSRSVVVVDVEQVSTSCGFSVPLYEWKGWRDTLDEFFRKKVEGKGVEEGSKEMDKYWAYKSQLSVDGLPGMKRAHEYAKQHNVAPLKKFVGSAAPKAPRTANAITSAQVALVAVLSLVIGVLMAVTVVPPEAVRRIQAKEGFF